MSQLLLETVADPWLVADIVYERAGRACEKCTAPLGGTGRLHPRQYLGPTSLSNAVLLCDGCQAELQARPGEAQAQGWLVRAGANPATVPVLVGRGSRWVYLTDGYADDPPEGAS